MQRTRAQVDRRDRQGFRDIGWFRLSRGFDAKYGVWGSKTLTLNPYRKQTSKTPVADASVSVQIDCDGPSEPNTPYIISLIRVYRQ